MSVASNLCCDKKEPRKLQAPLTDLNPDQGTKIPPPKSHGQKRKKKKTKTKTKKTKMLY